MPDSLKKQHSSATSPNTWPRKLHAALKNLADVYLHYSCHGFPKALAGRSMKLRTPPDAWVHRCSRITECLSRASC
jgi:hypothetical protein